uniref:Putative secreted protein n=1 Tax=Anopheles darlingi TaxID=43151 RepID=A0A2M4DR63_ANODA
MYDFVVSSLFAAIWSLLATSSEICFLCFSAISRRMKTSSTIFSSKPMRPSTDNPSRNPSEPPKSETN